MRQDLQYYLRLWRARFSRRRKLLWRDGRLQNGYCRDCLYCCGPQDNPKPFPLALLPHQMRPDLADDFFLLAEGMPYIGAEGCKSCGSRGCRLPLEKRPVACDLFPLVLANGLLYMYKTCPAVLFTPLAELVDIGNTAAGWIAGLSHADLRHIFLDLPAQALAERYIFLA
ncbi:MAG: hypothetical protein LBS77_05590 [Desulfovibrio sp.]|nr:hypothetical protein [Desulfovibrio sp.]